MSTNPSFPAAIISSSWTLAGVAAGGEPFHIDGIDIFQHKWETVRETPAINVRDPHHSQAHRIPVYRIIDGARTVTFAAGEFSNNIWGIHVPAAARVNPAPPLPFAPRSTPPRSLVWRVAPYAPLIAVVVEVPWTILMIMIAMGTRENAGPPDPYWEQKFYAAMLVPPVAGLVAGVVTLLCRQTRGIFALLALLVGLGLCAAFVMYIGQEITVAGRVGTPIVP